MVIIDNGFNPPTYEFSGGQFVNLTATVSCPGQAPEVTEINFPVTYAFGNGPLTDQARLFGTFDDGFLETTWDFSRP